MTPGQSEFWVAIETGDVETVSDCLSQDRSLVNAVDTHGRPACVVASTGNSESVLSLLIRNGADLSAVDEGGRSAIHTAMTIEVVALLLRLGLRPDARDSAGATPLHYHVSPARNPDIIELLLRYTAPIDATDNVGDMPIHKAVSVPPWYYQQYDGQTYARAALNTLLRFNASPNARGARNWTPLHYAAHFGRAMEAQLLLEHGADPNLYENHGFTPLDLAGRAVAEGWGDVHSVLASYGGKHHRPQ